MESLFTKDYMLVWALVLGLALFFPVRRLIWVLYVRRARRQGDAELDQAEQTRLKNRAGVTAALICFVFAFLYTSTLFEGAP